MKNVLKAHQVLVVGIDPAKDKHSVVALRYPDEVLSVLDIPNSPTAINELDAKMLDLSAKEGLSLVYATEDCTQYGALLAKVLGSKGRILKPVNPAKSSRHKLFYGDNKTDRVDARSVAAVAMRELDKLDEVRDFSEKDEDLESLSGAVALRNELVRMSVKLQHNLHKALYELWGFEYKGFFSNIDGKTALEFWKRYPSATSASETKAAIISKLIFDRSGHRITKEQSDEKAGKIVTVSKSFAGLHGEKALKFKERNVIRIVQLLQSVVEQLAQVNDEIEELLPDAARRLMTLEGVGATIAAELVCIIGDITRFENRNKFAKYNGTSPREWSSGKSRKHYPSRQFNRKLKKLLMNIAIVCARYNPISKSYYESLINRGKMKSQAYKCLARRISDIIFSMLKNGANYDSERHSEKINGGIRVDTLDSAA